MRRLLDPLYRFQKWVWRVFRPRTQGVKVMLFNASGDLVLIRNNYGRSDLFVLPGGGIKPWEEPIRAAMREIREELGCEARDLVFLSSHTSGAEGKRDTIHLFKGALDGELTADRFEVQEARFFALNDFPASTSPATMRRIEEYLGHRPTDGIW